MSFVKEFQELLLKKPRYNVKQVNAENSEYSDTAVKSKNCYYSFCVFYCEDVYYGRYSRKCTDCSGVTFCVGCQWCIECADCVNGYMLDNCRACHNCNDSSYCLDCHSCNDCFGCVGLSRRKYCWFNQQLSKEEYQKKVAEFKTLKPAQREALFDSFYEVRNKAIHLGVHQFRCENSIGENLSECADCYQCYDSFALEDCIYNIECNGNKNSVDLTVCFETENSYSCVQAPLNQDCNFLVHSDYCGLSEFCAYSKKLTNCFGCVYLSNKQYHILNQPYSRDDYYKKVEEIKKELNSKDLYNLSLFFVSDYEQSRLDNEEDVVLSPNVPLIDWKTTRMSNELSSKKLLCKNIDCKKEFLAISQELKIYDSRGLPEPSFCPSCRHKQRMALRNEREMHKRVCDHCNKSMLSTYPASAPYTVYCQKCFWENID